MMLNLLITSAVPFGYTRTMNESDCFFSGEYMTAEDIRWENFHHRNGLPLPDVIISNTPPPSPLRRTRSYHFLFPEKPSRVQITPTLPPPSLDTPPATPADTLEVGRGSHTRAASMGRLGTEGGEEDAIQTGLDHIQEVRRRLPPRPQVGPHLNLPQLSWSLPRLRQQRGGEDGENSSQGEEGRNQEERENAQGGEGEEVSRKIGKDLRKIADEFQVNNARVDEKSEGEEPLNLTVPVALTRCLSASILCLIWWRLFNKFQ